MRIETERLIITEFNKEMAQVVHENSLDEDNRKFVPDEVFETVDLRMFLSEREIIKARSVKL